MADDVPVLPTDPQQLLLCKVLLAETITPWRKAYQEADAALSMRAMRACIENRLTRPGQFRAPGATTWTDIIVAPGQIRGFHRKNGAVVIATQVQQRLDQLLDVDVKRTEPIGVAMRAFVRLAVEIATASTNTDPFADLPKLLGDPPVRVLGGTYGWRTSVTR